MFFPLNGVKVTNGA